MLLFQCSQVTASAQGWPEQGSLQGQTRPVLSGQVPLNRGSYQLSFKGMFACVKIKGLRTDRGFVKCFFCLFCPSGKKAQTCGKHAVRRSMMEPRQFMAAGSHHCKLHIFFKV